MLKDSYHLPCPLRFSKKYQSIKKHLFLFFFFLSNALNFPNKKKSFLFYYYLFFFSSCDFKTNKKNFLSLFFPLFSAPVFFHYSILKFFPNRTTPRFNIFQRKKKQKRRKIKTIFFLKKQKKKNQVKYK